MSMLPFFLLDPLMQQEITSARAGVAAAELAHYHKTLQPNAVHWSPANSRPKADICYDADSFERHIHRPFDLDVLPAVSPAGRRRPSDHASPMCHAGTSIPRWVYNNVTLPAGAHISAVAKPNAPQVYFDRDIAIPVLSSVSEYTEKLKVWMSCTPMEMFTIRPGVKMARGDVLMGGMGLGIMLREVAARKSVRSITIVEKSDSLLDWFGWRMAVEIAKEYEVPITVVEGSIYTYADSNWQQFDRILIDIWSHWWDAKYDKDLLALRRKVKAEKVKVWNWGARAPRPR